jgi:peptidyl-dipeptidase Dcp
MMKYVILTGLMILFGSTTVKAGSSASSNPFFKEFNTPFHTPPFNEIKLEHYLPAIEEGILRENKEIQAIVEQKDPPTFANTIESLERCGELLTSVNNVFQGMLSAWTNDSLQAIARTVTPLLTKHTDDIYLNQALFDRIKIVYDKQETVGLNIEQKNLLSNLYKRFTRGGINLGREDRERFRKINEELDLLALKFTENVLKENNNYLLLIDNKEELAGLPDAVIQAAAEGAKAKGHEGKWAIFLNKPSFIPVLQYAENRALREKVYKAYTTRGNHNNEYDNKTTVDRIMKLRVQKANLLGFKSFADFALAINMAETPANVYKFMDGLWAPAIKSAKAEVAEMQQIIDSEGKGFKLEPWDWWYYSEKVKNKKYALDEEMLRPYFTLDNVRAGAFALATKLYGIKFIERHDIPLYNPDVKTYEVQGADGKLIGVFMTDYYPRDGKQSGAWCNGFRYESHMDGKIVTPVIYNVGNFAKPVGGNPALLSFDDVTTLFHEFGHALDALFARHMYPGTSSFSELDVVELPSQIMENFVSEPAVLNMFAKHYKTGEPMPAELIQKIVNASRFNQGFITVEYMAAAYLDMDWHTITDTLGRDVEKFEPASMARIGLIPEISSRYQTTNFLHSFSNGYSAGYYSYLWAQVLDADAFQAFKEKGLFDPAVAAAFRNNVLGETGIEDAMTLYKRFRGREPKIDALIQRKGFTQK